MADDGGFARFDDRTIAYRDEGPRTGPPLVLSNSLGTDLRMWEHQAPVLARTWRVIRYDTRGHGRSSVPSGAYTMGELATDVIELLDHLDIARAHFCGLSLGGMTGLALAVDHADRLSSLAVCSATARIGTRDGWTDRMNAIRRVGMSAVAQSLGERWFTESFRTSHPDEVRTYAERMLTTSVDGYLGCCAALRDADLTGGVPSISTRTAFIAATFDPFVSTADIQSLARRVPGAVYHEITASHLSNVEAPTTFIDRLARFLRGDDAG